MKTFEIVNGYNKKGQDLVDAYKIVKDGQLPALVIEATKAALISERSKAIGQAVKNDVTLEEFEDVVKGYKAYMKGDAEFVEDAMEYLEENMVTKTPYSLVKKTSSVYVQHRIGIKSTDIPTIFGVDSYKASQMIRSGFIETFVDTYYRKKINEVVKKYEELISPHKVKLSDVYKVEGRNLFNIDVNICVSPSNIDDDTCDKITRVLEALETEVVIV